MVKIYFMEKMTIEESIISAMDMTNTGVIKYLPYILQDFWELGTSSEEVIKIIKKHKPKFSNLKVLDLGSGKGAISIKIASEFGYNCFGIDVIDDFVKFSNKKAKELFVDNLCTFETNDIRTRIKTLEKYDIILSIAIGRVFGNHYEALTEFSPHLNENGLIIIDDAYVEDDCTEDHPNILRKREMLEQINNAGMDLIEIITADEITKVDEDFEKQFNNIQKRCLELIEKYPEDKELLLEYIEQQKGEYDILSNEIVGAMFVIKKKV